MGKYKYLAGTIVMLVCEVLLLLFVCDRYLPPYQRITNDVSNAGMSVFSVTTTRKHLISSSSSTPIYTIMDTVLMVYRVIAFLWFFVVAWIINWALSKNVGAIPYNYFTHWNVIGLSVYFFTASLCSINYLYLNHVNEEHWYFKYRLWLAQLLQRTFDALGASALFITLVAFTLLNPEFEFWNVTVHFTTTIAVLIELTLNNVYSHSRNIIGLVMWMFVYVIFTWIIVPGAHIKGWPYFFLDTSTPLCFLWYNGLFVLYTLFFLLWIALNRSKYRYYTYLEIVDEQEVNARLKVDTEATQVGNDSNNGGNGNGNGGSDVPMIESSVDNSLLNRDNEIARSGNDDDKEDSKKLIEL